MFTSEEPTRFALSCIGSRAMAGALEAATLDGRTDENGTTFAEVGDNYFTLIRATDVAAQHSHTIDHVLLY